MAYTETTELLLKKATPGTNQAFETAEVNNNWDKVDNAIVADRADIADLQAGTSIVAIDGGTA